MQHACQWGSLRKKNFKNLCNHAGLSAWLDTNKGADRHEAHSAISCWSHDLWMSNSANLNKNRIRIDLSFRPSLCLLFCLCLQTPVIKTDNCLFFFWYHYWVAHTYTKLHMHQYLIKQISVYNNFKIQQHYITKNAGKCRCQHLYYLIETWIIRK